MNIQNISKEKRNVIVELEADDLVMICNALYSQLEEKENREPFFQLYSDMMMVRDLCQYGHIDNFCLSNIVKYRNNIGKGLEGVLSDDDIDTFNSYLEGNDMPTAFGNTDWRSIYNKIVGYRRSEKLKQWIENKAE